MNILITGGAGFIGSHLCDFFINRGDFVICIDNLITGRMENISHLLNNKNFVLIKHDISKPINLEQKIDAVLHFASPASPKDYYRYPIQTLKAGSLGTHNALGIAKKNKAMFLLASTSEVYGDPLEHPQKETYWGNVNPVGPRGVYDEAKRFAEAITMAYSKTHKLDTKIARIFNTYGPRMRLDDGRALPNFITQALRNEKISVYGKGEQTRCFCYIQDMVEGLYKLLFSDEHLPVNLGSDTEIKIIDAAKIVIEIVKKLYPDKNKSTIEFLELPQDDPKRRKPDLTKARTLLNWEAKTPLEEGLKITIEYIKNTMFS